MKVDQLGGYYRCLDGMYEFGLGNNQRLRIVNLFEMCLEDRINRIWCGIDMGVFGWNKYV